VGDVPVEVLKEMRIDPLHLTDVCPPEKPQDFSGGKRDHFKDYFHLMIPAIFGIIIYSLINIYFKRNSFACQY
jgi:hypothetical protein